MFTVVYNYYVFSQLDDVEAKEGCVFFQEDGAPPQYHNRVRPTVYFLFQKQEQSDAHLEAQLLQQLMCFLGICKTLVYSEKIYDINH